MRKLEYADYYDSLTGLLGRNGYDKWIASRQERNIWSTGILILDINCLKESNEFYGHAEGDKILVEAAQVLKKYFDEKSVFRMNGDAFLVACENIPKEEFDKTVQKVEKDLKDVGNDGAACGSIWDTDGIEYLILESLAEERMKSAKEEYHRRIKRNRQNIRPSNTKALLKELRAGYYYVFLQPKVNIDFGMKYMNTAMLALVELETLKIDKNLVQNLESSKREQAVVRHLCDMCEELRTRVVAEEIERKEQMQLLKELGCKNAQGYFFGKPMPPEELIELIQE